VDVSFDEETVVVSVSLIGESVTVIVVGGSDVRDCIVAFCNVEDSVVARFVVGGCVVCGCEVEVGPKSVAVSFNEEAVVVSVSLIGAPVVCCIACVWVDGDCVVGL
jgi:3-phosphoglycerate kinase